MYLASIVVLMVVAPIASIIIELSIGHGAADLAFVIGRWFVFWAGGVRLFVAGFRQVGQPGFTAREIFDVADPGAARIVQEIGFANLAMGLLGIASIGMPTWVPASALASGLYYGLAGLMHLRERSRNRTETIAMVSDLAMFVVLAAYLGAMAAHA